MAYRGYADTLELLSNHEDDGGSEPDEPLSSRGSSSLSTLGARSWPPRWLRQSQDGYSLSLSWQYFLRLIRPRLTIRYILSVILLGYVVYCIYRGSPLLASRLPKYSGKYHVSTIDLETSLVEPRIISNSTVFAKTGTKPFELQTVLFSLYYPAIQSSASKKKHPWIPRPIQLIAEGYASLGHVNNIIVRYVLTFTLWAIAGSIDIPASVDAKLYGTDNEFVQTLPLMVFSHGFASSRTDYTHYCGELASRGHVVAVLEHRDGSSAGSYIVKDGQRIRKVLPFSVNDIISDPPMDLPKLKFEQLAFRTAEIEEVIKIMKRINSGHGQEMFTGNPYGEGRFLQAWKDRLDFTRLSIAGHSYGATGALQALKSSKENQITAAGSIIFDPGKSSGPLNDVIEVPILVIHSNSWSSKHSIFYGKPHFDTVKDLVRKVVKKVGSSWFVTSIGTSHPSVTDAPLIEPWLLGFTTGATINVQDGLKQYVGITLDFLEYLQTGNKQGILAEQVTHPQYNEWVSEQRKLELAERIAKFWQIHVS